MTNARVKIDLGQGFVEAEGSEEFVRLIYDDFKSRMESLESSKGSRRIEPPKQTEGKVTKQMVAKKRKVGTSRSVPSLITDLDLSGGGNVESLRDFYARFKPLSNFHRNLIFVYYLIQKLGMTGVTVDHVFSCYRDIPSLKTPSTYQSLVDTNRRHGWVDTSSTDDIKVTIKGINYLEHDMPKPKSE